MKHLIDKFRQGTCIFRPSQKSLNPRQTFQKQMALDVISKISTFKRFILNFAKKLAFRRPYHVEDLIEDFKD